jgi:hypothetical protein
MKEDEARRLKALEQENSRLKKIVAEQALEIVPGQVSWTLSASDRLGPAAWTASGVRKPVAPWGLMRL